VNKCDRGGGVNFTLKLHDVICGRPKAGGPLFLLGWLRLWIWDFIIRVDPATSVIQYIGISQGCNVTLIREARRACGMVVVGVTVQRSICVRVLHHRQHAIACCRSVHCRSAPATLAAHTYRCTDRQYAPTRRTRLSHASQNALELRRLMMAAVNTEVHDAVRYLLANLMCHTIRTGSNYFSRPESVWQQLKV